MNRRQLFLPTVALFIFGLGHESISYGQAAAGPFAAQIKTQVDILVQNTDGISDARKQLIEAFFAAPAAQQDAYIADLSNAFLSALSTPVPVRTRLEIAIVTSTLAPKSHNLAFVPLVTQLLNDSTDPVVLWAERAAGAVLPDALTNDPTGTKTKALIAQMVASVGASGHCSAPLGGDIADTAIKGLIFFTNPAALASLSANGRSALVDYILQLEQARIAIYQTGVPESPQSDSYPILVLFDVPSWPSLTVPQQLEAVQEASDLIGSIGQRYGQGHGNQNPKMLEAIQKEAGALQSIEAKFFSNSALDTALVAVNKLNVGMAPTAVNAACQNVYPALIAIPKFSKITPPPTIK